MTLLGCDLSVYQWFRDGAGKPLLKTPVYFEAMKAMGVRFAFVRATTIDGKPDYAFELNWEGLKRVGIPRGAYGFGNQQNPFGFARAFYEVVSSTGDLGELPPVMDFENRNGKGKITTFQAAKDWLDHVETLWDRKPIIYTSQSMWFTVPPSWTNNYYLWVANYTSATSPRMPAGWDNWLFWQYTSSGNGLAFGVCSKEINLDLFNGNEKKFEEVFSVKSAPSLEDKVSSLEKEVDDLKWRVHELENRTGGPLKMLWKAEEK